MNTDELADIISSNPNTRKYFKGVFPCDQIPQFQTGFAIINTDPSTSDGRHWVLILRKNQSSMYFCSLAEPPEGDIRQYLAQFSTVQANCSPCQFGNEISCGCFCIFVADMYCLGYQFSDICALFDIIRNDDIFIREYMRNKYKYELGPA